MKKLLKLLLILAISGAVVTLVYWGGKKGAALFRAAKEPRKTMAAKTAPIAPRTEQKPSLADQNEFAVAEKNDYTFFETLNDPEMKKIVGLNNRIQDKPVMPPRHSENKAVTKETTPDTRNKVVSPAPSATRLSPQIRTEENQAPEVSTGGIKENVKKAQVTAGSNGVKAHASLKPQVAAAAVGEDDDKAYTVQISSFKDLALAQGLQTQLQKKGYPAYLLTVESPGKGGLVYRVFLGKYIGQNKAKAAANKVKREDKIDAVVVLLPD